VLFHDQIDELFSVLQLTVFVLAKGNTVLEVDGSDSFFGSS
jgi:hypothetical protein